MMGADAARQPAAASDGVGPPRLRLVDARLEPTVLAEDPCDARTPVHSFADCVLVAGSDPCRRARMLAELRSLLPVDTDFREASETWEVIAQACDSRLVVIAGDLGETPASVLLRLLARRNPALPVLAVGGERRLQGHTQAEEPGGRHRPTVDATYA